MINNLEIIKPLLTFPKPGDSFYFLQILQRKKDHPGKRLGGSNNNSRLIKAYYIKSVEHLDDVWEEITTLCNVFNARAGVNLNPRSFEKAAYDMNIKIAHQMKNREFEGMRKSYDSVCGEYHAEMDKRWIVDIDTKDLGWLMQYRYTINMLHDQGNSQSGKNYKILAEVPSRSGFHIITQPFNLANFAADHPGIEVHKNNPTNLYIP
jgi:hypothetical protein